MRKSTRALVAAALLTLIAGPATAVNKCTGPDGAVVFQDAPCEAKGEKLRIMGAGQANPNSSATQYWQREAARQKREAAAAEGLVTIGMSADEVRTAWGDPTKINRTISEGATSEQWVYRRGRAPAQYVYVENGVVRTIQTAE